jgi:hypothetical protein
MAVSAIGSTNLRDRPEFHRGRRGERLVADLLQRRGWHVIPSYDYAGEGGDKPPRLQGCDCAYPIPDLDVSRGGVRRWVEVKTKAEPTWTRVTGRLEHGVSLRLYESYRHVQAITGCPVWIVIVEERAGAILCAPLDGLEPVKRVYNGRKMGRGGMVFWPRKAFAEFPGAFDLEPILPCARQLWHGADSVCQQEIRLL